MLSSEVYESSVQGRQEFRAAYRRLRDGLDRIARFGEAYEGASEKLGHDGKYFGPALAIALARYARSVLNNHPDEEILTDAEL